MKQKHWQVSAFEKTSETIRDDTFYTTDTKAYLIFELIDEDFTPDSAIVTVYNIYGKATINANVEVTGGIVQYKMPVDAIGHPGGWRTQVIFIEDGEDHTTTVIEFDVEGHLLDNKKPTIVDIENWNSFMKHAGELIDDWKQLEEIRQTNEQQRELAESARQNEFEANETSRQTNELVREEAESNRQSTFETNETKRQTEFEANEVEREGTFETYESTRQSNESARETAESERVSNEEERISNESERIESEVARKEEMEKARYSRFSNHTYDEIGERLDTIESNTFTSHIFDKTGAPGPKSLLRGNEEAGFYGFVQPHEFGTIEGNPVGREEMSASNLALALGITQGIVQNDETAWMKFHRDGDILFHPVKPLRSRISWNHVYEAGAVYGDGTIGVNPPNGRAGDRISVDGSNNAFVIDQIGDHWRRSGANIANVGDTIVARGFSNSENNGEFTVQSITDHQIVVDGNLTTEEGNKGVSVYNKADAVNQDAIVTIGGNTYDVLLLRGGDNDPLDSYNDADRDLVGSNSDWSNLVLPLHERAKVGDWNYKSYAGDVEDWGIGLTDETLVTHHTVGEGSYRWMQETGDVHPSRRVGRGYNGASGGGVDYSWATHTSRSWAPALRLLKKF